MLAQSAVAAIRSGCEMLRDGNQAITEFKDTVEKGVGDARKIYGQVTGLWGWITSLFSGKRETASPTPPTVEVKKTTKPVEKKTSKHSLTYEQYQAQTIHDVCQHLKTFFEVQRQLNAHCKELEQQSLTTEKVADTAIDRIEIETQLNSLSKQIREAMTYVPQELGLQDLYKRFLKMYDQILVEQEFDRELKLKQERDRAWQREHRQTILIYKATYATALLLVTLEMMGLYFTL